MTSAAGEVGFDTTKKEALIGDAVTAGGGRLAKKNVREILVDRGVNRLIGFNERLT